MDSSLLELRAENARMRALLLADNEIMEDFTGVMKAERRRASEAESAAQSAATIAERERAITKELRARLALVAAALRLCLSVWDRKGTDLEMLAALGGVRAALEGDGEP